MATTKQRKSGPATTAGGSENYAAAVLERFAKTDAGMAADREFYVKCVWAIARGEISEVEQQALDALLAVASPGTFDFQADLDAARKITDWQQSGNSTATSDEFFAKLADLQKQTDDLAADLEKSRANTARLTVQHNSAVASLNKFESRGRQWSALIESRPHLFGEAGL
jgi:hypothetical protein